MWLRDPVSFYCDTRVTLCKIMSVALKGFSNNFLGGPALVLYNVGFLGPEKSS